MHQRHVLAFYQCCIVEFEFISHCPSLFEPQSNMVTCIHFAFLTYAAFAAAMSFVSDTTL
jgi:hypothetical protein